MSTENWLVIIGMLGSLEVATVVILDRRFIAFKKQIDESTDRKVSEMNARLLDEKIKEIERENERLKNKNDLLIEHNNQLKEQVINTK